MTFVLALDFGGTKIDVGAADLDGEVIRSERIETHAGRGAIQAVERAIEAARGVAERTESRCAVLGAVTPGIVEDERVLLAPNVPGWSDLHLPALLREGLGVASDLLCYDVNGAAL